MKPGGDGSFSNKVMHGYFLPSASRWVAMKNICEICELKFPLSGRLRGGSRYENTCEICELKFPLGRRCRKVMVKATMEHALREIPRRRGLLVQIYG